MRFEIRAAGGNDLDELTDLAAHLNSVNLPYEADEIAKLLQRSERSFSGEIADPGQRQYVFVLRDLKLDRTIGTSMILAQLGSRDAPYIFFDVRKEERYSASLDRHFVHQVLSIGYSYHGPTEIGGLVLDPAYRRSGEQLGLVISYVRFLFIAVRRELFQGRVLAELMPPLEKDGRSHLWEAVGRRFTGLSYREADRLSRENKEFIRGLFPSGDIYASLLSPEAQSVIGRVGDDTRGVEKMLTRVGFRYWNRVDPFDGGPHYIAPTDEISLIQNASLARVELEPPGAPTPAGRYLVAHQYSAAPWWRATALPARLQNQKVFVQRVAAERFRLAAGQKVALLPLDGSGRQENP